MKKSLVVLLLYALRLGLTGCAGQEQFVVGRSGSFGFNSKSAIKLPTHFPRADTTFEVGDYLVGVNWQEPLITTMAKSDTNRHLMFGKLAGRHTVDGEVLTDYPSTKWWRSNWQMFAADSNVCHYTIMRPFGAVDSVVVANESVPAVLKTREIAAKVAQRDLSGLNQSGLGEIFTATSRRWK